LSRLAGLPDDAFRHDGQITKRTVRAATLAALSPLPQQRLWDVGAGAGSIAIEWLRGGGGSAIAIERETKRAALIAENAAMLGVPELAIVTGEAPTALKRLPEPDAVFLGGGLATPGVVEAAWHALKPGGRLVANAVTVEGETELLKLHQAEGGRLIRISVAEAETLGGHHAWRALMPVTQLTLVKAAT
jgi:precorrin-6Y C5,15-methyltransferase (decarboxylating)